MGRKEREGKKYSMERLSKQQNQSRSYRKKTDRLDYIENLNFYTSKYVMSRVRVERQQTGEIFITCTQELISIT